MTRIHPVVTTAVALLTCAALTATTDRSAATEAITDATIDLARIVEVDRPVTVTGTLGRRGERRVVLQRRYHGADTWDRVRRATTDAMGRFTFTDVVLVRPPANPVPLPFSVRVRAPRTDTRPAIASEIRTVRVVYPRPDMSGPLTIASVSSAERLGDIGSGDNGYSISGSGRFVVFASGASWADPMQERLTLQIFIRDRTTGTTTLVTRDPDGGPARSYSFTPLISGNGNRVVFWSNARLVEADTDRGGDLYWWNRKTTRAALIAGLPNTPRGRIRPLALSADGRFLAFASHGHDLAPDPVDEAWDLYVLDRRTGTADQLPTPLTDPGYSIDEMFAVSMSDDGRYVAYAVDVPDHGDGSYPNNRELRFTDRLLGVTQAIPVDPTGALEEWEDLDVTATTMSADGRYVAYGAPVDNPRPDLPDDRAIFVWDSMTGASTEVTHTRSPSPGDVGYGPTGADLSADGRYLAFRTYDPAGGQIYRVDREEGTVEFVVTDPPPLADRFGASFSAPLLSDDGSTIAFGIDSQVAFVPGDINRVDDVFVWGGGGTG